ncbi:Uncharacterised protein g8905 [Pycnogonum litorale]
MHTLRKISSHSA